MILRRHPIHEAHYNTIAAYYDAGEGEAIGTPSPSGGSPFYDREHEMCLIIQKYEIETPLTDNRNWSPAVTAAKVSGVINREGSALTRN